MDVYYVRQVWLDMLTPPEQGGAGHLAMYHNITRVGDSGACFLSWKMAWLFSTFHRDFSKHVSAVFYCKRHAYSADNTCCFNKFLYFRTAIVKEQRLSPSSRERMGRDVVIKADRTMPTLSMRAPQRCKAAFGQSRRRRDHKSALLTRS